MYMSMRNVEADDCEPNAFRCRRLPERSGYPLCRGHDAAVGSVFYVLELRHVLFRDNERMALAYGVDVEERKNGFVLIDLCGRYLSDDDFAENTVWHD